MGAARVWPMSQSLQPISRHRAATAAGLRIERVHERCPETQAAEKYDSRSMHGSLLVLGFARKGSKADARRFAAGESVHPEPEGSSSDRDFGCLTRRGVRPPADRARAAYRCRVDVIGPDTLIAHAAWMRRLALALTGGEAEADDLVQEAYLAALRRPPDPARAARPWLAEVVRNAWRMRLRGERRRRTREEAAPAGDAPPAPDALLDRAMAQRLLADCVVSLDEPFRRTLLLRYFEGLSLQRIAEAEGVAHATIRWRLAEALARLRATMDERAGERKRWTVALAFAAPIPSLTGALIMKTKTKLVIAAVALLAAGGGTALVVHHMRGGDGDGERRPASAAAHPGAPAAERMSAAATPPAGPAPARDTRPIALISARAELDPSARQGSVEGRVVDWATSQAVAGAEVALALEDGATTAITSDGEGRFRYLPDRAGRVVIASITRAGYLPFAPEWGHSPIELMARPGVRVVDVVIYLIPAVDYTGLVVDAAGAPVAGARVRIIDLPAGEQELVSIPDRFTSNRKGEFVFHAPDFALLEARADGHGPGRARLDGKAILSHKLVIRLPPAGGAADQLGSAGITGQVVGGDGQPLPGALVRAEVTGRKGDDAELVAAARAVTGDDGRFALPGLDAGLYAVTATDGVRAPAHAEVALAAGQTGSARLVMAAGAVLRGVVVDTRGEPVPAFTVVVFRNEGLAVVPAAVRTVIDRDGLFAVEGLAAGGYRVQATAHGHAPSRTVDGRAEVPPEKAPAVVVALPDGGTLTGLVRSEGGGPLDGARVSVEGGVGEGTSPVPFAASAVTDASGQFTLRGLAPGRRSVVVAAYNHHETIMSGLDIADGAVIGPIEVVLTPVKEGEEPTTELVGIGAVLAAQGEALLVQRTLPGSGAEKAGLVAGDLIVSVDGTPVNQLGMDGAIQAIRGPIGTSVMLGVKRASSSAREPVMVVVERMKIKV